MMQRTRARATAIVYIQMARLMMSMPHNMVVAIEGESYRLKEAKARAELKAAQRRAVRPKAGKS